MTRAVLRSVVSGTPFLTAGCMGLFMIGDGYLGVQGVVYRALPSERSSVTVDMESTLRADREPLAGCTVALEPWTTRTRPRSAETRTLWTKQTITDANGSFVAGGTAKPGNYDVTVSVTCPGAGQVQRVFRHDRQGTHELTVTLAPSG